MKDDETRKREIAGICEAAQVTGCKNLLVITLDEQEEISLSPDLTLQVLPAWRWMLASNL
jgi:hypothetical protein